MRGHYSSLLLSGCRLAASAMLSVCGTAPQALPCVSRGRIVRRSRVAPARAASGDAQTQPVDETVLLGKTNVRVSSVGIGAWSWGDRSGYWGKNYDKDAAQQAFDTLAASGLSFIDTAEVYGSGLSEEFTGEFVRSAPAGTSFQVASKFAPLPWRFNRGAVVDACRASLARLGMERMSLYIQHWPGFATNGWCNDAFLEGLADCVDAGLCDAVGVSNFKAERVRGAVKALGARGVVLSSNQVQYSLLYREPERNGVLEACREAGVTVVAYSPLAQGLLTGKYTGSGAAAPSGPRAAVFTPSRLAGVESLLGVMREIGQARGGKTPGQIAINWCLCKGTLPIPGVKNARQAQEVAGALGWRLTPEEVRALDAASDKVGTVAFGAPFEKW